jgi:hypothetical protein
MNMRALLKDAGYCVTGNRADCRNCRGGSRNTISFTSEVAYCHRCAWTANTTTLTRALGRTVEPQSTQKTRARERAAEFAGWVDSSQRAVAARYRNLGRTAEIAKDVLVHFPDCEPAWGALGRFYHDEARLAGMLDVLSFERVSVWLEFPSTPVALFQKWEAANA